MLTVVYNDDCSKCAGVSAILDQTGLAWARVRYLRGELTDELLGDVLDTYDGTRTDLIRTHEAEWIRGGLNIETVDLVDLKRFVMAHPIVLQRPIVVVGGRAVIARPPEVLWDFIDAVR